MVTAAGAQIWTSGCRQMKGTQTSTDKKTQEAL
jgi:hypothetical protein